MSTQLSTALSVLLEAEQPYRAGATRTLGLI